MKSNKARVYNSTTFTRFMNRSNPDRKKRVEQQMLLANTIYEAMRAKGWNQKEFAKEMGKLPSEISKWLSGNHNFTSDTLFEISEKLGINLINYELPKGKNNVIVIMATQNSNDLAHFNIGDNQINIKDVSNAYSYVKGQC